MKRHERALEIARTHKALEGELLQILMDMHEAREISARGYSSIFVYCLECLGFSEANSFYFQKVTLKSLEVPALKAAVDSGLSVSKARRIVPVLTSNNASEWIQNAFELLQRKLERAVAAANPRSSSRTKLHVEVSLELEKKLRRLQDLYSQKLRRPASLEDVLEAMSEEALEKHDPIRKAARARKVESKPVPKGRVVLPARIKHAVAVRDGAQCTAILSSGKRCSSQRWLDVHHEVPLFRGGSNEPENLRTVCGFHHRHEHRHGASAYLPTPHGGRLGL